MRVPGGPSPLWGLPPVRPFPRPSALERIGQPLSRAEAQEEGVGGGELLDFGETATGFRGNIVLQKVKVRFIVPFGNRV